MSDLAPTLLALLQTAVDTTATRLTVERSWIDTAAGIAQSLVSVLVLVMLLVGIALLWALKKSVEEMTKLLKTIYDPVMTAAVETRDAARELLDLTRHVRGHVDSVGDTVVEANDRLRAALHRATRRMRKLDALVGVVQDEAQHLVVNAVSAVRGAAVGGSALGRALRKGRASGQPRRRPRRAIDVRVELPVDIEAGDDERIERGRGTAGAIDATLERPRIRARDRHTS
jgi:hypothetical protein